MARIIPKKSSVKGRVPQANQLDTGEIAINIAAGSESIYVKNNMGEVSDVTNLTGGGDASNGNYISGIEVDGRNISIKQTELPSVVGSDKVTKLTGYNNTGTTGVLSDLDSLNTALEKLENKSYSKYETDTKLNTKVDKITGKSLSTNDYTTLEKTKLASLENTVISNSLNNSSTTEALSAAKGKELNEIKLDSSRVGQNNGVAPLDSTGKVPLSNLPSYPTKVSLGLDKVDNTPDSEKNVNYAETAGSADRLTNSLTVKSGGTSIVYDGTSSKSLNLKASGASSISAQPDGSITISSTDTQYAPPIYVDYSSGLYKISTNNLGHVDDATPVLKSDIMLLGIPGQDTTYSNGVGLDMNSSNVISVKYGTAAGTSAQGNDPRLSDTRNPRENTLSNQNLDDLKLEFGFFYAGGGNSCVNKPEGVDPFGLIIYKSAAGYVAQELISGNGTNSKKYIRQFTGVKWTEWDMVYTSSNPQTSIEGNSNTADKLKTPRLINGTSFDGSSDITTSKWGTSRVLSLSGDVSGSVNLDGSSNVSITTTVSDDSHNHIISNIDNLQGTLDLKAPLISPSFTGVPTAPTASQSVDNTQIATTAFVQGLINNKISSLNALSFKGVVSSNANIPTSHVVGWTYIVSVSGTYVGEVCEPGDMIICVTTGTVSNNADWNVIQSNINGAVTGPSSSVNSNIAVFNGTTGKIIKDSGFSIAKSVPASAEFTDTKVTSVGNHYVPSGGTSIDASGGAVNDITNSSSGVQVITGVTKDASGHITGVTSKSLKSVNTTYSVFTGATTVTGSTGLVPAPAANQGSSYYLGGNSTWNVVPTSLKNPNSITFTGASTGSYDGSSPLSIAIPVNTDTHWTAKNVVTSSATSQANASSSNGSTFLNLIENGAVRSSHKLTGSGSTLISSDSSGNIIIDSTNTNTTYTFANGSSGNFTVTPSGGSSQTVSIGKPATATLSDKATSLNTSRNLWGQPFIGTADVSGNMTGVGSITQSGSITGNTGLTSSGIVQTNRIKISSQNAENHIEFTRGNYNYITAPSSGIIGIIPNGKSIGSGTCDLIVQDKTVFPGTNNYTSLGSSSYRWSDICSVDGDLSGNLSVGPEFCSNPIGQRFQVRNLGMDSSLSYLRRVILLLPVPATTNQSGQNSLQGKFLFYKIGGNMYDEVDLTMNCIYNTLYYKLNSHGANGEFKLGICSYNSINYYCLIVAYNANPYTNLYFTGLCKSDLAGGSSSVILPKPVSYYQEANGSNAAVVINKEINDSLTQTLTTSVITSVSTLTTRINSGSIISVGGITAPTFTGALSGNSSTATTLQTARTINGTSFNGSSNIVTSSWGTARTFTLTGSVTGSVSVDGSGNISLATNTNHVHTWDSVTGKPTTFHPVLNSGIDWNAYFTDNNCGFLSGATNSPISGSSVMGITIPLATSPNYGMQLVARTNRALFRTKEANVNSSWYEFFHTGHLPTWDEVSGKPTTFTPASHTHLYAGSASAGGPATTALTCTGNSLTSTTLQNARLINGTSFNGSVDITTTKWGTARTFALTGSVTGSATVDGSGNISLTTTTNHTHNYAGSNSAGGAANSTAGTLTIQSNGTTATTFNGSSSQTFNITRNSFGAAIGWESSNTISSPTIGWYRIATSSSSINNCIGIFEVTAVAPGYHSNTIFIAGTSYGITSGNNLTQLGHSIYSNGCLTKARLVYHTTYTGNYAYLEVYLGYAVSASISVKSSNITGWLSVNPSTAGSIPAGYSTQELIFSSGNLVGDLTGNSDTSTSTSKITAFPGLSDATYGSYGGIIQDSTTGPVNGSWYNKIKILHNNSAGYYTELAQSFTGGEGLFHRRNSAGTVTPWKTVLDSSNYNSYSPTKTGVGASGSWGISVTGSSASCTGNASTASTLQTARSIALSGAATGTATSFNGGSNITIPVTSIDPSDSLYKNGQMLIKKIVTQYINEGSSVVGSIKISMPSGWTSAMMGIEIDVYDYSGLGYSKILVGGYNYSSASWVNTSVSILGNHNYSVRLGYDGSKCCILLGTSSETWAYPKVVVRNVMSGFSGYNSLDGVWSTSLITSDTGLSGLTTPVINSLMTVQTSRVCSGNSSTSSKLLTSRTLWGQSFDGSGNVSGSISGVSTLSSTGRISSGYDYTSLTGGFNASGGSWTNGYCLYDGTGTTARLTRISDTLYLTRGGDAASGLSMDISGNTTFGKNVIVAGSLTANASSATKLQTARTINGTNFDGTAAITTANWGTSRTLTIGDSGKAVNGSGNVAWTPTEIGFRQEWTSTITCSTWSRLCYVIPEFAVIGASFILTIGATRNSVVYNNTFSITTNHPAGAKLTKLSGSDYTSIQLRVLSDNNGNCYVEVYDNGNSATSSTTQTVYCRLIPISTASITKYTSFTSGATIPSGFAVNDSMTCTGSGLQSNSVNLTGQFNGSLTGSASKLGTSTVGSSTIPMYLNAGTATQCSTTLGVSITGSSASSGTSSYVNVADTRATAVTPNGCTNSNTIRPWFSNNNTPNGNWWSGISVKGWSDGYESWQICSGSHSTSTNTSLYYRNGLNTTWNPWRTLLDSTNYTSYTISSSDSRLTNSRPASDVYAWAKAATKPSYNYSEVGAMRVQGRTVSDCNAADFRIPGSYGFNGTPTNAPTGQSYTSLIVATNVDTGLQIAGGYNTNRLAFRGWAGSGSSYSPWNEVIHNSNYTTYTVTKTGGGASGSWGISVTGSSASCTGNAATATTATTSTYSNYMNGVYTGGGGQQPPSYVTSGKVRFNMMNTNMDGDTNYKDLVLMDTYTGGDVPYVTAIGVSKTSVPQAFIMSGPKGNATASTWVTRRLLDTGNYSNYVVPKTGGTFTGNVTSTGFYQSSDRTLKENISEIEVSLLDIEKIPTVKFNYKEDKSKEVKLGTIAQDIEDMFPEVVDTDINGLKAVDYSKLSVLAIGAIKSLNKKVDKLIRLLGLEDEEL